MRANVEKHKKIRFDEVNENGSNIYLVRLLPSLFQFEIMFSFGRAMSTAENVCHLKDLTIENGLSIELIRLCWRKENLLTFFVNLCHGNERKKKYIYISKSTNRKHFEWAMALHWSIESFIVFDLVSWFRFETWIFNSLDESFL